MHDNTHTHPEVVLVEYSCPYMLSNSFLRFKIYLTHAHHLFAELDMSLGVCVSWEG